MAYLGSWKIDDYLTIPLQCSQFSTGAAYDATGDPAYRVYEDETATAIATGTFAKLDDDNTTGFYTERLQLTTATGFEKGKCYTVYKSATVDGVAGAAVDTFQIEAEVDANTVSPTVSADAVSISGDTTAADNLEVIYQETATVVANMADFFDGTGYAGTNNVIPTVTTLTNAPSDSSGVTELLTRVPDATAGENGGLTICGSNAATTFATLSVTGQLDAGNVLVDAGAVITGELAVQNGVVVSCTTENKDALSLTGNGTGDGVAVTTIVASGNVTANDVTLASLSITGQLDANNLLLDGGAVITGELDIQDGIDVSCTTGDKAALRVTGNGSGAGMQIVAGTGNALTCGVANIGNTTVGTLATGAATIASAAVTGALTVGDGIAITCSTAGRDAIIATGNAAGAGLKIVAGSGNALTCGVANIGNTTLGTVATGAITAESLSVTGALTVGDGIAVTCSTSNRDAIAATGNGTGAGMSLSGGTDGGLQVNTIKASGAVTITGGISSDITGDITGTLATCTNVTTVNGLAANCITATAIQNDAITAAKIADAAIDNATFAADVGDTAYATNIIALAADKALLQQNLDHLVKSAVDTSLANTVADNSVIGYMVANTVVSGFDRTTDSLEQIVANSATAASVADAVWDEASTGHTDAGKAGQQLWTDVDAILADTGTDGVVVAAGSKTGYSLAADQSAVTVGTVTTTTNVTNAPTAGDLTATMKTSVETAVQNQLNTAIGASPTVGSINERVKAVDDKLPSASYLTGTSDSAGVINAAAIADGAIDAATFAVGAIDSAAIATNAIDADALASDVGTEIAGAVWDTNIVTAHGGADSAGICLRSLDGIAERSNTPTLHGLLDIADSAGITIIDAIWDEQVESVHQTAGSAGKKLDDAASSGDPWSTDVSTGYSGHQAGNVVFAGLHDNTPQTGDAFARLGAPVGASFSADIAAVKSETAAIVDDTGTTGVVVASINANAVSNSAIANDAISATKIASAAITAAKIETAAITADKLAADALTAAKIAADVSAEIADAVWNEARADHVTDGSFGQGLQIIRSGTAQAGAAGTITLDASASATSELYNGQMIHILSGTGAGQTRKISTYAGDTKIASVSSNWATNPSSDSVFIIYPRTIESGTGATAQQVWEYGTRQLSSTQAFDLTGDITGNLSGSVGSVTGAVGSVTGAVGSVTGAVGSVTGAVGSVTGDVGGKVLGGGGSSITAAGVRALDDSGNAIAPAATALLNTTWTDAKAGYVDSAISAVKTDTAAILADTGTDGVVVAAASKTGYALADTTSDAVIAGAVWDAATGDYGVANSYGAAVEAVLDDTGSSGVVVASGSKSGYSLAADQSGVTVGTVNTVTTKTGFSLAADQSAVTIGTVNTLAADSVNSSALAASALTEIENAVWNATRSGHTTSGTFGEGVTKSMGEPIRKNTALANFEFMMTLSATGAPATGKTVSCQRSIDGATFANCGNPTATEVSNGWYKVSLTAGDLNGDVIGLRFSNVDCNDSCFTIVTSD